MLFNRKFYACPKRLARFIFKFSNFKFKNIKEKELIHDYLIILDKIFNSNTKRLIKFPEEILKPVNIPLVNISKIEKSKPIYHPPKKSKKKNKNKTKKQTTLIQNSKKVNKITKTEKKVKESLLKLITNNNRKISKKKNIKSPLWVTRCRIGYPKKDLCKSPCELVSPSLLTSWYNSNSKPKCLPNKQKVIEYKAKLRKIKLK